MLGAIEPRGAGFMPNQLFLYWMKSVTNFWSSGENFKMVDNAFIKCSRSSDFAVMYLKFGVKISPFIVKFVNRRQAKDF